MNRYVVLLGIGTWFVLAGLTTARHLGNARDFTTLQSYRRILFDATNRGVLPRYLMHLTGDVALFVARQDALLFEPDRWIGGIEVGSVYVSDVTYPQNSLGGRDKIIALLRERGYTVVPTSSVRSGDASASYLVTGKRE